MKLKLFTLLIVILLQILIAAQGTSKQLDIKLLHDDAPEQQTREQLLRLLRQHDISRWILTAKIVIDSNPRTIPHSHPVLTLSTRHLKDDELLLSTFAHEQMHWLLTENPEATEAAVKELRVLFPTVPTGFPDGAQDERSSYIHLIVCWLEGLANRELHGELRARQIMEFWATDHYRWIYRTVLERGREIGGIAYKHKLVPPAGK